MPEQRGDREGGGTGCLSDDLLSIGSEFTYTYILNSGEMPRQAWQRWVDLAPVSLRHINTIQSPTLHH